MSWYPVTLDCSLPSFCKTVKHDTHKLTLSIKVHDISLDFPCLVWWNVTFKVQIPPVFHHNTIMHSYSKIK